MARRAGTEMRNSEKPRAGVAAAHLRDAMLLLWSMHARPSQSRVTTPPLETPAVRGLRPFGRAAGLAKTGDLERHLLGAIPFGDSASSTPSSLSLSGIPTTFSQWRQMAKATLPLQAPWSQATKAERD